MRKLTQSGLTQIVDKLTTAVKLLKREKTEDNLKAADLFQKAYLSFFRTQLKELKHAKKLSVEINADTVRDAVSHIIAPLEEKAELLSASKLLAKYIINPGKKGMNFVGIERMSLIAENSKNPNVFQAWEQEWDVESFYDDELGVNRVQKCDACSNSSSKTIEIANSKNGAKLVLNYECFNNFSKDIGVKLGGRITSVKHAKQQASNHLAEEFTNLLSKTLSEIKSDELIEINREQGKLPAQYRIVADENTFLSYLKNMQKYFNEELDFTAGQKEFEPNTNLRGWVTERIEDPTVPQQIKNVHRKFLSLSKMTLAEKVTFIQDYKLHRPVSVLLCKPVLDDLFELERKGMINTARIQPLLKSRITPAIAEQITGHYDYKPKRKEQNHFALLRYGPDTSINGLQKALPIFFKDKAEWYEAFSKRKNFDKLDILLNEHDYMLIKETCRRLTVGYSSQMPLNYDIEEVRNIITNEFSIPRARQVIRGLAVLERKLETDIDGISSEQRLKLKGQYIPVEDFSDFTDIDCGLENAIDKIEHSLVVGHKHARFLQNEMNLLKESISLGLINKKFTYSTDGKYSVILTTEQTDLLNKLNQEIDSLHKKIKSKKVSRTRGREKTESKRERDELITPHDELIIKRYLTLKGDHTEATFRDERGRRITADGKLETCVLNEAFNTVKNHKPITEYGDLGEKINEIADLLETESLQIGKVPNLNSYFLQPRILRELKYIDEKGLALILRLYSQITTAGKITDPHLKSIPEMMDRIKKLREDGYSMLVSGIFEPSILEFDEKSSRYIQRKKGIEVTAKDVITHDLQTFEEGCLLEDLVNRGSLRTVIQNYNKETYAKMQKTGADAKYFQKFVEIARDESRRKKIKASKELCEKVIDISGNLPYRFAQARRRDAFFSSNQEYRESIQNEFVKEVYNAIESQPLPIKADYWRIINGTSTMYFDRYKKKWAEGPLYQKNKQDEKYWKENLMRFLDQTQLNDIEQSRFSGHKQYSYVNLGYLLQGIECKINFEKINNKLERHLKEGYVRNEKELNFFKSLMQKMEYMVNDVILKSDFLDKDK